MLSFEEHYFYNEHVWKEFKFKLFHALVLDKGRLQGLDKCHVSSIKEKHYACISRGCVKVTFPVRSRVSDILQGSFNWEV